MTANPQISCSFIVQTLIYPLLGFVELQHPFNNSAAGSTYVEAAAIRYGGAGDPKWLQTGLWTPWDTHTASRPLAGHQSFFPSQDQKLESSSLSHKNNIFLDQA